MSTNRKLSIRIGVSAVGFATLWTVFAFVQAPQWAQLIAYLTVYLVIAYDTLWRAAVNIAHGQIFDENFLMIVATVGAFAIGDYREGLAVMLFYQVGELFQKYAVGKSRRSIGALMDIRPDVARIVCDDGQTAEIEPERVEIGQTLLVRAGERIAVDGVALQDGTLDMAALTGESRPYACKQGERVLSGAINMGGTLTFRAEKQYSDSTVAKILDLVENASDKKAKAENFISKFARWYTPAVVLAALALAVIPPLVQGGGWTDWVHRALSFLVVSCPCALVISVPMSFFGGIGGASRVGVLVKGGNYLELLHRADTFVFDKTGTLTQGKFAVESVSASESAEQVLAWAALAERQSNHPIARAIVQAAPDAGGETRSVREIAGKGVVAETDCGEIAAGNAALMREYGIDAPASDGVGTIVYVAKDGAYVGAIRINDSLKPDTADAIRAINEAGCKTIMLTGDGADVARQVCEQTGVREYHAQLLPADKVERLETIMRSAKTVAYVGDGINDAPVLMRADVGIAMGGVGSDAAIESADIVLMHDDLSALLTARAVARKTMRIVWQNIVFALAVKAAVLVLSALGITNMWLAVFADVGVAILAIVNAMRCMRAPRPSRRRSAKRATTRIAD